MEQQTLRQFVENYVRTSRALSVQELRQAGIPGIEVVPSEKLYDFTEELLCYQQELEADDDSTLEHDIAICKVTRDLLFTEYERRLRELPIEDKPTQ